MNAYSLYCYLSLKDYDGLSQRDKDYLDGKISIEEYYSKELKYSDEDMEVI